MKKNKWHYVEMFVSNALLFYWFAVILRRVFPHTIYLVRIMPGKLPSGIDM